MSYTITHSDGSATVEIVLGWTTLSSPYEAAVETATKRSKENTKIKGFRKGHVPEEIAKGQVDRMQVLSQVVDDALRTEFSDAVKGESLKIAGNPEVSVKKMAEGNDVEVALKVALIPVVELPKEWKKTIGDTNADFATKKDETVSDDDVAQELERLAQSRTTSAIVTRPAKDGDQVKIDFDVLVEGVLIEGGSSKDYALILGKGAFIAGFEEQIIGLEAGSEKSFKLTFPEKYHADHLAGKEATFRVTLHSVEERTVPEIDDAFAASLGGTFTSRSELEKNIREGMESEKVQSHEEARKSAYLEKLSDAVDTTIPQSLMDEEVARMVGEMEGQSANSGMSFDNYLKQMGKTREDLHVMWQPQARKRILSALLLEKLGEEYAVDIQGADIEAEMNKTMAMYNGMEDMKEKIDMKQLYEYTKGILRNNEVFTLLGKI